MIYVRLVLDTGNIEYGACTFFDGENTKWVQPESTYNPYTRGSVGKIERIDWKRIISISTMQWEPKSTPVAKDQKPDRTGVPKPLFKFGV